MKKKLIYLLVVMLFASFLTSANQTSKWPGHFFIKSIKQTRKLETKKHEPDFDVKPAAWLL
jgi:hypothetical protein